MRRLILLSLLVTGSMMFVAEPTEAQTSGTGGIIEWIHKLSGPQFIGGGITGWGTLKATSGIRARLSVLHRWSVDEAEEVTPEASLTMLTFQPALELPLKDVPVELGVGMAIHRFQKNIDPFWHYSFPVYVQGMFPVNRSGSLLLRPGVGVHIFPAFGPNDFAPLAVAVSRDKAEVVLHIYFGVDFRLTD